MTNNDILKDLEWRLILAKNHRNYTEMRKLTEQIKQRKRIINADTEEYHMNIVERLFIAMVCGLAVVSVVKCGVEAFGGM